jgi:LPS sulfotransferase NodH
MLERECWNGKSYSATTRGPGTSEPRGASGPYPEDPEKGLLDNRVFHQEVPLRRRSSWGQENANGGHSVRASRSLVIAATPRSGSYLLSDLLRSTGVVGNPREYFHVNFVDPISTEMGLEPAGITRFYIDSLLEKTVTKNGIFSTKLHWLQINQLADALRHIYEPDDGVLGGSLLERAFPDLHYLYLRRLDKARQATSYFRAMRSEEWWEIEGGTPKDADASSDPALLQPDYLSIRWLEDQLLQEEEFWKQFFTTFAINPLVLNYEDLVANPTSEISRVLSWLGIEELEAVDGIGTQFRKQSTGETERVLAAYHQIRAALPAMPSDWTWSFSLRTFVPRLFDPDGPR